MQDSNDLPSDSAQLAKHQAGEFEYVLTLPALTTPAENTAVDDTPSTIAPEARQGVTTVQFGCNLIRADGKSDIGSRRGSDSGNTYTLIATPIECSDETETEAPELAAEKVEDMATATVAQVAETPTLPEQAILTNSSDKPGLQVSVESLVAVAEPSKSALATNVTEVPGAVAKTSGEQAGVSVAEVPVAESPSLGQESEKPREHLQKRMPGLVSITVGEVSSDQGHDSGNDDNPYTRLSSQARADQPPEQSNDTRGHQRGAARNGTSSRRTSEILSDGKDDVIDELMSLPPAPRPSSRIEDSVEALDKLEEQLEAMDGLAQIVQVPAGAKPTTAAKQARPGGATHGAKAATDEARDKPAGRSATVRHSIAVPPSKQTDKTAATQAATSKRLSVVSRPASLAPPKPLVRSSKPPTVSTFELPGEAVAQRLKEKRLARLSMSMPPSAQTTSRASSPTKPKTATSTKPPTRPNFELPGEAISRRKREEHEAKLKAAQEEERKRREFKARPVRASVVAGSTFPRQTATSRARMSLKAGTPAEGPATTSTTTPSAAKRHSTIGPGTSSRASVAAATTGSSSVSRGRASVASASTGSARGSSTLSAEDMREQKMRGKEIFKRESSFVSEKERERRSREEAAKQAREEAAERSRKASREWAEKQKARKAATVGGSPSFAA